MASIFPTPPILRLHRSPQSGNYAMTGGWQTVFAQNQNYAWIFASAKIDLSNMAAGDSIEIRVQTRNTQAGAFAPHDAFDYDDAQPANKQKITIGTIVDTFGVIVEMRQTAVAVALIQCYCEFYDAVR